MLINPQFQVIQPGPTVPPTSYEIQKLEIVDPYGITTFTSLLDLQGVTIAGGYKPELLTKLAVLPYYKTFYIKVIIICCLFVSYYNCIAKRDNDVSQCLSNNRIGVWLRHPNEAFPEIFIHTT